jgi:hypothetical protein
MLLVDGAHERSSWWQDLIDEDEDCLFGAQLDALADNVDELTDGEVGGDKVLLLVDGRNIRLLDLLADDLLTVEVSTRSVQSLKASGWLGKILTGIRSAYFWRMRSASALRFSKGCSSLNLERMMNGCL